MMEEQTGSTVTFDKIISALLDNQHPFPPVHLHRFSDIAEADLRSLERAWHLVNPDRRAALLEDLEELADADTLVSFEDLGRFALNDPDSRVREVALRLLWESEDPGLIQKFLQMVENDPEDKVRAAAATALGQFIYLGELEEISQPELTRIEDKLLALTTSSSETKLIRRRALEALGFSSRPELKSLIMAAYNNPDQLWQISALFAMGRSANSTWIPYVMDMLDTDNEEILFEAVRAIGELEAPSARRPLLKMLRSHPEGSEIRMAAIWSLSKIGGEKVRDTLEKLLDESEDDEETEMLEDALENLEFTEGFNQFGMIDYEPASEESLLAQSEADAWDDQGDEDDEDEDGLAEEDEDDR
jgi:HEAT repeat protein